MSLKTKTTQTLTLASVALYDAYTDFVLSRQAMICTKATMEFYQGTAAKFLKWIESQGVTTPQEVTARYVRQYLAGMRERGLSDQTLHDHARAIRTLTRFWHNEGYITQPVKFDMPRLAKKRLPVLSAEELRQVINLCNVRDKALVLFMVDSGLRRAEVCNLNWSDVDMQSGLVKVRQGKGRKDRSAVIGVKTRRALLAHRRTLSDRDGILFQSDEGTRLTGDGIYLIFRRLRLKTKIHITAHALRRTFVIMSLRNGMNVLHLQALLGHAGLEMVQHYAQMVDDDLLQAHKAHSPIDNL